MPSVATIPSADPWAYAADALDPPDNPYRRDIVAWAKDRLNAFLWSKQREIGKSLVDNRYTAVPSCFDSGKSWLASVIACWWLDTHPIGQAFVVTTAPTDAQVKAILWREIQARFEDAVKVGAPLPGRVTLDAQWKTDGGRLIAYGRKPAIGSEVAFAGIHDLYVLVIMDEADGIPSALFDAVDGLLTNEYARCLAIGNPYDAAGPFAKACAPGSGWKVIRISADETPNFTDERIPDYLRPLLVSKEWVEERVKRWGRGSPRWVSKVEGWFPNVSDDTLIEPAWIQRAAERDIDPDKHAQGLGADIARYGDDMTCIGLRSGGHFRIVATRSKQSTMRTAGAIARMVRNMEGRASVAVDADGLGSGVVDRLEELELDVIPLHGGWAATDTEMFGNARAEWYWQLRLMFEAGEVDIDPLDDDLMAQLGSIKFKQDSRGRIWVETKDEMRRRHLPSPDRADAMAYTYVSAGGVDAKAFSETWRDRDAHRTPGDGPPSTHPAGSIMGDLLRAEL